MSCVGLLIALLMIGFLAVMLRNTISSSTARRHRSDRPLLLKHRGHVQKYRVNRYGEIFEDK